MMMCVYNAYPFSADGSRCNARGSQDDGTTSVIETLTDEDALFVGEYYAVALRTDHSLLGHRSLLVVQKNLHENPVLFAGFALLFAVLLSSEKEKRRGGIRIAREKDLCQASVDSRYNKK